MQQASRAVGLDPTGAELISRSVVSVYRLETAPVIARVSRTAVLDSNSQQQLAVARWLTAANAPVTRMLGVDQEAGLDGYHVTFWEAATEPDMEWRMARLGPTLRELHTLPPDAVLPRWRPFDTIRSRMPSMEWLDPDDRDWLMRETDELEAAFSEITAATEDCVIHGDTHVGNILQNAAGEPVLCDLDSVAVGPRVQDLVPTAVDAVRFQMRARQRAMVEGYGYDVVDDPAWPILRRIRELSTTSFGLHKGRDQPRFAGEAVYRLRTLRDGATTAKWQPYPR